MVRSNLLFIAAGAVIILISIPLMRRRVPPNALYGLRVPSTFADEWVWYEANARSGRDLVGLGLLVVAVALLLPAAPGITPDVYGRVMTGLLVIGALGAAVIGWRRANRLLREQRAGGMAPGRGRRRGAG
jgi:uncharacterized membrane protein